jgi:D-alanyl-D-alanine carboxypeptidase
MADMLTVFWALLLALVAELSATVEAPRPLYQETPRITLPGLSTDRPALMGHVLSPGESLDDVATLYGTSVPLLEVLNPDLSTAAAGSRIAVPVPGPAPALLPCGDLLAPLDKDHAVPRDCEPSQLAAIPARMAYAAGVLMESRALDAFTAMVDMAAAEGHELVARSSYRSWPEQELTFQSHVERSGIERASMVSARPGHSEHQLGTTVDVTNAEVGYRLTEAFGETGAGRWLAANAWRFGFVLSYPAGEEEVTGYKYEPWHFRWVGKEAAAAVRESGLTLHTWLLEEWRPGRYLLTNP